MQLDRDVSAEAVVQTINTGDAPSVVTEPVTHTTLVFPVSSMKSLNDNEHYTGILSHL